MEAEGPSPSRKTVQPLQGSESHNSCYMEVKQEDVAAAES